MLDGFTVRAMGLAMLLVLAVPGGAGAQPQPAAFSEDAEALGRLAVSMLGTAAGQAQACGQHGVAAEMLQDARTWVSVHAVPIEPEATRLAWNAVFDEGVRAGVRQAMRLGCGEGRWVSLARGAEEIGRNIPVRLPGQTQLATAPVR
ncbi:hypothetical protein [Muricoccus radiodurans]|uniref:hypothetical protein n=1 Tax=Muricoccus radiodurans TaxID=2231721 RepID=UPI003CF3F5CC